MSKLAQKSFYEIEHRGLYFKTLQIRNVRQMAIFCDKIEPDIVDYKHTNFDKQTSLLWNTFITNP